MGDASIPAVAIDLDLNDAPADHVLRSKRLQIQEQMATALTRELGAVAQAGRAPAVPALPRPEDPPEPPAKTTAVPPVTILALLLEWHAEDCLASRLALFAPATIVRWREAVVAALADRPTAPSSRVALVPASPPTATTDRLEAVAASGSPSGPTSEPMRLARLVALAAEWAPYRPPASQLHAVLADGSTPLGVSAESSEPSLLRDRPPTATEPFERIRDGVTGRIATEETPERQQPVLDAQTAMSDAVAAASLPRRASIETALPFLMLGPLHGVGWLAVAAAVLAESTSRNMPMRSATPLHSRSCRHLNAAGVAHRASSRPLHSLPELAAPPAGAALAQAERALGDGLSALDAVIADALVRGHDRNVPLLLVAAPPGLALVDPQGLFLVALGLTWGDVLPAARAAAATLLVDPSLPPAICTEIDVAGLIFAMPGMPTRGERWDVLVGPGAWRGLTNAAAECRHAIGRAAARWAPAQEEARGMLAAMGPDRALAPGLDFGALDRTVTLAAALALGDICWRLMLSIGTPGPSPNHALASSGSVILRQPSSPRANGSKSSFRSVRARAILRLPVCSLTSMPCHGSGLADCPLGSADRCRRSRTRPNPRRCATFAYGSAPSTGPSRRRSSARMPSQENYPAGHCRRVQLRPSMPAL